MTNFDVCHWLCQCLEAHENTGEASGTQPLPLLPDMVCRFATLYLWVTTNTQIQHHNSHTHDQRAGRPRSVERTTENEVNETTPTIRPSLRFYAA